MITRSVLATPRNGSFNNAFQQLDRKITLLTIDNNSGTSDHDIVQQRKVVRSDVDGLRGEHQKVGSIEDRLGGIVVNVTRRHLTVPRVVSSPLKGNIGGV